MSTWTLNDSTFTDLSAADLQITLKHGAPDEISFCTHGAFDADLQFAYDSTVVLKQDGVIRFTGSIITPERSAQATGPKANQAKSIRYTARGPWADLEDITFEQYWQQEASTVTATMVTLGRDIDNVAMTTGEVLAEILDSAIDEGANLTYVSTELDLLDVYPPESEETDASCSTCIANMLRWQKTVITWFDYTSTVPVLHFTKKANATALSLSAASGGNIRALEITDRPDLAANGVVIYYISTNTVNGVTYNAISSDTAGTTTGKRVVKMTVRLEGLNLVTQSCEIETESAPATSVGIQNWLIDRHPALSESGVGVISWSNETVSSDLDKILSDGTIPSWTGETTERGIISADATITYTDGTKETLHLTDEQTFTDTTNVTFCRLVSTSGGEEAPSGNATKIYNQLSDVGSQGSFQYFCDESDGTIRPGKVINFTGTDQADWSTLQAAIQTVTEKPSAGVGLAAIDVTFGPPEHLTPQDFVELSRTNRIRHTTYLSAERSSGVSSSEIIDNGAAATTNATAGRTALARQVITNGTNTIDLNPDDLVAGYVLKVNDDGTDVEWAVDDSGSDIPDDNITGTGVIDEIAVFDGTQNLTSSTIEELLLAYFGLPAADAVIMADTLGDYALTTLSSLIDSILPTGTDRSILYNDGTDWVVLSSPTEDQVLKCDAGTYGLRWDDESGGLPDTSAASQYQVLQLDASLDTTWDYVRAH